MKFLIHMFSAICLITSCNSAKSATEANSKDMMTVQQPLLGSFVISQIGSNTMSNDKVTIAFD